MSLAKRLLIGSLGLIAMLVIAVVLIAGNRLRARLADDLRAELERDARLVATQWLPGRDADSLANTAGRALGRRVTIVDTTGTVIGDSEFDGPELARLENHRMRPEIVAANARGVGSSMRSSASAGDEEMYLALRSPPYGFVRVSLQTAKFRAIVAGAQRDVLVAGVIAFLGASLLVLVFSRTVSQPIIELRDVAQAIAAGNLERRPALAAPGEVGDLAQALHRMTEQLATRLAALESEDALLRAVIESLDEGIVVVAPPGDVIRLNESARRLLRLQATPPFPATFLPSDRALRDELRTAMNGAAPETTEITVHDRTLLITARPIPGRGAVIALMDLTARRRLETVRRDFVANVSHELKTPLTVIAGFAETLRDEQLAPADRARFVSTIESNARRMQRIVDDLLDLSRYESGGWKPSVERNDLRGVVTDTFTAVQRAADAKGLTLAYEGDEATEVVADPTALRQVLANLVENAVRYTSQGHVTVAARGDAGGTWIRVSDTGSGIAPEHLGRIFERFYRVDPHRGRDQGGTGLGLAIVRHLVEAHGGHVTAESVLGRGTSISAFFPPKREG